MIYDLRMPNRLADETSPYLLQHKDNPVDWWPWSEEALAEARRRGVPVFLSVGYSACHWCHVMEHESFESEAIAALMNAHFVNIKVDREERPDIDAIYMNAVQLMTGSGGWPMSVFMRPDGQPFFGGTYWPPTARFGRPGFREILLHVHDAWENRRDEVDQAAASSTQAIRRLADPLAVRSASPLHRDLIAHAADELVETLDRAHGGFGGAPKFPHAMDVRVLLRAAATERPATGQSLEAATITLDAMAAGGIYDHLGGGFHRYSTDAKWLVPHFEKMLYDQALLLPAYLEAWQLLPDDHASRPRYEAVIRETLAYLHREMIAPDGGYAATQDADSEGEEGKFFVWSEAEIRDALGDEADLFAASYDVSAGGNWEGHTILNRPRDWDEVAAEFAISRDELEAKNAAARKTLFDLRANRIAPGRDEKVLASWNGMMIAAAARCGAALDIPEAIDHAAAAARFVLDRMRDGDRLMHTYKDGRATVVGHLDDYAAMIDGLCELYQATGDGSHLHPALELAATMRERFADPDGGAYFYTASDDEKLITRQKEVQDSAVPSSVALAATGLLKLGLLTGQPDLIDAAESQLAALSPLLKDHPRSSGQALIALAMLTGPPRELVVAGDDTGELLRHVRQTFLPSCVVLTPSESPGPAASLLAGKESDRASLFVCERGVCQRPVRGLDEAIAAVDAIE